MSLTLKAEILNKYKTNYFVETGTFTGLGVKLALSCGIPFIHSFEIDINLANKAKDEFKNYQNVFIWWADSGFELWYTIAHIQEPICFFLDAHKCQADLTVSSTLCPLRDEIRQIGYHKIKTHTLIIDDVQDLYSLEMGRSSIAEIQGLIRQINPEYKFSFEGGKKPNDILVAQV